MSKKKYTKEEKRMFKKKNKNLSLFSSVVVGMFIVSTVYFIFNLLKLTGVENLLRYILIGVLGIFTLYIIKKNFSLRIQPKKYKIIIFSFILLLLGFGMVYASRLISRGISTIDNLNKNEVTYSTALIKLKSNKEVTKDTVSTKKIGIISDTDDTEGYVLAQTIIKKLDITDSNLVKYDEYITMLKDLYSGDVDAVFVSGGYVEKYSGLSSFENIKDDVKVISKYKKTMKKRVTNSTKVSTKSVTEPFTMLLLGVDSPEENISDAVALGDTIMVVTFNPNTLNATLFSIPRDTYVPITCYGNALSKITHAASGGDSCMIETVQNFIDIDIDYYAKINFRGLMNLVDALGGIDVDVPYSFCETDENRTFYNAVFVKKGMQHLDGRAALGLARNRKYYPTCGEEYNEGDRSDFVRGQNQQLVLKAILKRAKEIRSVDQFYNVLDTISKSMDTNLSREQILGFYNIFKKVLLSTDSLTDGNDVISMQRTFLRGGGGIIMDHVAGTGLYEFVPSQEGLNAIKKVMRINLGLEQEEYDKSFSF
ncbi:MAG: LCP family protein, partial [Bacilli bacterium]|nr:LCP family protein [Bacilli bacterium]